LPKAAIVDPNQEGTFGVPPPVLAAPSPIGRLGDSRNGGSRFSFDNVRPSNSRL